MKTTGFLLTAMCAASSVFCNAQTKEDSIRWEILLNQVSVTAQKPLVKQKNDRISYDVASDDDSKTLNTMNMLRKVPFLTVDNDGNIKIKGSGNIRIFKDGRPNNSFTNNAKQVFEAIPASLIDRIEVITEPGARYDAEGVDGILNIVMKKNVSIDGLMGTVALQTDNQGEPVGTLYLGTKLGRLDLSTTYSMIDMTKSGSEADISQNLNYKATGSSMNVDLYQNNPGLVHVVDLSASYELDSLNLISASLDGVAYNVKINGYGGIRMLNGENTLWGYSDDYSNSRQSYYNFDGKVDYQHLTRRQGEIFTLSYLLSTSDTHYQLGENYFDWVNRPASYDFNRYFRDNDGMFVEHTFQADWERPISQMHALNVGAKYINRNNSAEGHQKHDGELVSSNDFSHVTDVLAAYAEYRFTSPKWSATAGLRYEYANLRARFHDGSADNYGRMLSDFVPFASLYYKINDANSLRLNYSSRVERPGIDYLNPFRHEDMIQIEQGNPYLDSSRPGKVSLTHTFISPKIVTSFSVTSSFGNDGIGSILTAENDKLCSTYGNVQKYASHIANLYVRWQPTPKTNLTANLDGGWAKVSNDNLGLSQERWYGCGNISFLQDLWWKVKLQVNAGCSQNAVQDVYTHHNMQWWHGIGLRRSFLREDRLNVMVGVNNPFMHREHFRQYINQPDMTGLLSQKQVRRWFVVSVSYRFGNLRSSVKKANKTIENDDLVGQKKQ